MNQTFFPDRASKGDVAAGHEIEPPAPGKVFPWLAQRTGLTLLVNAVTSLLNLTVNLHVTLPDGQAKWLAIKPVFTNKNSTLTIPIDLTGLATGGGGGGSGPSQFKFVSDGGDYYNCRTWNGSSAGPDIIKVAKPYPLRCGVGAITSATIGGVVYTYTYALTTISGQPAYYLRTTRWPTGNAEIESVNPYLLANDIILADPFSTNGPSSLQGVLWIARADGRAWSSPP